MDTVVLLATLPAIVALVNFLKQLGLPSRSALLAAVVFGVVLSFTDYAYGSQGWYQAISSGLILGLGAAGVYDLIPEDKPERK